MGMFSEISNGGNAKLIGEKILLAVEENPETKEFVRKYFLPIYNDFVVDAYGCENKEVDKKIFELFGP